MNMQSRFLHSSYRYHERISCEMHILPIQSDILWGWMEKYSYQSSSDIQEHGGDLRLYGRHTNEIYSCLTTDTIRMRLFRHSGRSMRNIQIESSMSSFSRISTLVRVNSCLTFHRHFRMSIHSSSRIYIFLVISRKMWNG